MAARLTQQFFPNFPVVDPSPTAVSFARSAPAIVASCAFLVTDTVVQSLVFVSLFVCKDLPFFRPVLRYHLLIST